MFIKKSVCVLLFNCFFCLFAKAQNGIHFIENTTFEEVLILAKKSNKNIFIDAYTKWCLPCKNLDITFTDRALGDYFNEAFINVKFDMDHTFGKDIHKKYDVVFVPTMLIIDPNGNLLLTIESSQITASNLLQLGKQFSRSDQQTLMESAQSKAVDLSMAPEPRNQKENIVYVLGEHQTATPEQLRKEAYFRIQLMDGSHIPLIEKYLEQQTDWLEKDNLQFIYDFIFDATPGIMAFFFDNRTVFEKEFGSDSVSKTIDILKGLTKESSR